MIKVFYYIIIVKILYKINAIIYKKTNNDYFLKILNPSVGNNKIDGWCKYIPTNGNIKLVDSLEDDIRSYPIFLYYTQIPII
jgi:hypothetical protein